MLVKTKYQDSTRKFLFEEMFMPSFRCQKQKGSPLADRFYQIQSRRGSQKATIALAHQLLKIAYILLKEQITYPEFLAQKKTTRDELVA